MRAVSTSMTHTSSAIPSSPRPLTFALVAGEASGDVLGAGLIRSLAQRFPGAKFVGVGGAAMREAGLEAWHDCSELAVMGIAEVLKHLPRLWKLRQQLARRIAGVRPAVFIGIDAPDFNLSLERTLRRQGIATVHYVCPSIWAWREGRAKKIGYSADRVLCLFPMEPPIIGRYGGRATFVGHPTADAMALEPDRDAARNALNLDSRAQILGLLPGSRLSEISKLGALFILAAARFRRLQPSYRLVAPMANPGCRAAFQALIEAPIDPEIAGDVTQQEWRDTCAVTTLVDGQSLAVMQASNLLLMASGTAALEGMLAKRPMVVAYRISPFTFFIVKSLGLLKINRYSLPNVLSGEELVPELMQQDCTPEKISTALSAWLTDHQRRHRVTNRFIQIHESLRRNASESAAEAVTELIANRG